MKTRKHIVLYIPAETFPTHHSLMTEVYSKNDYPVKTTFLMRHVKEKKDISMQTWNKADVYTFPRYSKFKIINSIRTYFCFDLRYLYLMPYIIFKHKITIIQVRDLTFPLFIALIFKFFFRKKVIYQKSFPHEYRKKENALNSQHKFPWLVQLNTQLENNLLHFLMKFCDAILPISKYMAKNLQRDYGLPENKMHPFGLGFQFENISINKKRQNTSLQDNIKLIYIGTLSISREFDTLLHGLSKVISKIKNKKIEIEFVGGNHQEIQALSKIAKQLNIQECCYFTGKIKRNLVYEKILQSHIGISWFGTDIRFSDASPTKMIEYLSFGIPVVAVDTVIMHNDILKATTGGLCCKVDADDFSRKLQEIIYNYELYNKNAILAMEYMSKKYSYSIIRKKLNILYDNL